MSGAVDRARAFVRERLAVDQPLTRTIEGGPSLAYAFGSVLVFLLVLQAVTGIALAAFYSPSSTDAWASVAYIQDQTTWGWLVRGLHHHGGSAIVVVAGIHLVQTALSGAYKRPREIVWWLGILLLLALGWAVTGYVLRWDQAGYWANRVELGIAEGTPLVGEQVKALALGGNDYGNLTLTRFYALHVLVLPVLVAIVTIAHVKLARRHGTTPLRSTSGDRATPRWPDQSLRDAIAIAIVLAILLAYVVSQHGADLAAPADPSNAYDARPLWYLRWLFHLRELAGSAENIVALVVPALVAGFLAALPRLDRGPDRAPRGRIVWLGALAGLLAVIAALTVMSLAKDANDDELAKRRAEADKLATHARTLAREHGVPSTGAADLWATQPMYRARQIYAKTCKGCHEDPKDREGPLFRPGHHSRAWFKAFLKNPSGDEFYGRTDLVKLSEQAKQREAASPKKEGDETPEDPHAPKDLAMPATALEGKDLDAVVELLYAQSGAADVDRGKLADAAKLFESACSDCHSIEEGVSSNAPNLHGIGTRDYYRSFISNPASGLHMTGVPQMSQMPRFDKDLTLADRDALAEYLVWLGRATPAELEQLGPVYP